MRVFKEADLFPVEIATPLLIVVVGAYMQITSSFGFGYIVALFKILMAELSEYLAGKRVTSEMLNIMVKPEYRNKVALGLGKDWESLATFIGIPSQDIYDLKETYSDNPRNQRLGMMKRWEELHGREALSYAKLIEGLELTGRRDLTEFLVNIVIKKEYENSPKAKDNKDRQTESPSNLSIDGTQSSFQHSTINKPGSLPLRNSSCSSMLYHETAVGMGVCGPQSEPVRKHFVDSPGKMFWGRLGEENSVMRRASVTPDNHWRTSMGAMGQTDPKMFKQNCRYVQMKWT